VTDGPAVGAAIDLGSNSVHHVVARIDGHVLVPLVDESAFLGLGAAVDGAAALGSVATDRLVETLAGYTGTARSLGATTITLLGTEPIRRAADAARVVAAVGQGTGLPLHVLSHEEEAWLTLIGVTGGAPVRHETLVVDIGGGSSEFCAVGPRTPARAVGLRIGSQRLTVRVGPADPPTPADFAAFRDAARQALRAAFDDRPSEVRLVGGTASNLLKVAPGGREDPVLTRERLAGAIERIGATPAATLVEQDGVNPVRASLMAAGAILVEAILDRYGVDVATVSEAGLREGAILVADHAGVAWRDQLTRLAHGWRT